MLYSDRVIDILGDLGIKVDPTELKNFNSEIEIIRYYCSRYDQQLNEDDNLGYENGQD